MPRRRRRSCASSSRSRARKVAAGGPGPGGARPGGFRHGCPPVERSPVERSRRARRATLTRATMRILGIETSCDETSAAVVRGTGDDAALDSLVILSQDVHRVFGGVVPESASRAHLTALVPVARRAVEDAGCGLGALDAIAVTNGPGLGGAALVGGRVSQANGAATGVRKQ